MDKMLSKIQSNKGESIGETLVALLVASLALVMLAGAISTGTRIILRSKTTMEKYYNGENDITSEANEAIVPGAYLVLLSDKTSRSAVSISEDGSTLSVDLYSNKDSLSNVEVYTYRRSEGV